MKYNRIYLFKNYMLLIFGNFGILYDPANFFSYAYYVVNM